MLKRIGLSTAVLFAALAFVQPGTASARDRDDYHRAPEYSVRQERVVRVDEHRIENRRFDRRGDEWRARTEWDRTCVR